MPGRPESAATWSPGTRDAVYVAGVRVPWEQVEAADWDVDTSVLRISEVGSWGDVRPEHVLTLEEPGRLLELVRERVTATVVLQRHVPVRGRRGLRVIARRAPGGDRPVTWIYEYDAGIDPGRPRRPGGRRGGPRPGARRGRDRRVTQATAPNFEKERACLLACAGCNPIPCSSTGRAFGC